MNKAVGLEGIAFAIPKYYVDMEELAIARDVVPAKYLKGLGQTEMSVATPCEDAVTLAAEAGRRVIDQFEIEEDSIGLVIIGTETGVDHSKPIASQVHELLNLNPQCRVYETKHACYGATAALTMATDWILSGRARGKKALIIASDIARYGLHAAGEPTSGAGSVAMIVSDQPRLFKFDTEFQGYYSKQVMDFWRPLYSKEAFADGHYSMDCYLEALTAAYQMYRESSGISTEEFPYCLYHVPFVKMAQKGHQRICEIQWDAKINKESENFLTFKADYQKRVAPALNLNARVGNIYTGSLYLSLLSLLEQSKDLAGKRISLFSYGSGCMAEYFSGTIQPEAASWMSRVPSESILNRRVRATVTEYEAIVNATEKMDQNNTDVCAPERWRIEGPYIFKGTQDHIRQYEARTEVLDRKPISESSDKRESVPSTRTEAEPQALHG